MLPVGTTLGASHFVAGQHVDVQGFTIGKGFQGPMKRWGFAGLPASHGTTKKHRAHGSIGNSQDPGRVWKGKKMAGRMGNRKRTVQNVFVYKVDPERNLLYVKGQVPGKAGLFLKVRDALRKPPPFVGAADGDWSESVRENFQPGVSGSSMGKPSWATGAAADVPHAAAPYPAWGIGALPAAPERRATATMLDPSSTAAGGRGWRAVVLSGARVEIVSTIVSTEDTFINSACRRSVFRGDETLLHVVCCVTTSTETMRGARIRKLGRVSLGLVSCRLVKDITRRLRRARPRWP